MEPWEKAANAENFQNREKYKKLGVFSVAVLPQGSLQCCCLIPKIRVGAVAFSPRFEANPVAQI
jgi:hypothetical protein